MEPCPMSDLDSIVRAHEDAVLKTAWRLRWEWRRGKGRRTGGLPQVVSTSFPDYGRSRWVAASSDRECL